MVTQLGMSEKLGPIVYGGGQTEVFLGRDFSSSPDYSDATAREIDAEIHGIITSCFERAEKLLRENVDKMHFIAEFLVKHEIMDDVQFAEAMKREDPTVEEIAQIGEEKRRRRAAENEELAKRHEEERRKREEKERNERIARESFADEAPSFADPSEDDPSKEN